MSDDDKLDRQFKECEGLFLQIMKLTLEMAQNGKTPPQIITSLSMAIGASMALAMDKEYYEVSLSAIREASLAYARETDKMMSEDNGDEERIPPHTKAQADKIFADFMDDLRGDDNNDRS